MNEMIVDGTIDPSSGLWVLTRWNTNGPTLKYIDPAICIAGKKRFSEGSPVMSKREE